MSRVYDEAEAKQLLEVWNKHRPTAWLVAVEIIARYRAGVLEPLALLIEADVQALIESFSTPYESKM